MATIYTHITGGGTGDNCLILDSKERLIYPFNVGDYSEIRFAMVFSYAPITGSNGVLTSESFAVTSPSQAYYFGLCNYNTGTTAFPGQPGGFDFIGACNNAAAPSTIFDTVGSNQIRYYGGGDANNIGYVKSCQTGFLVNGAHPNFGTQSLFAISPNTGVYGETNFSSYFGFRFLLNGNVHSLQSFYNPVSTSGTSNAYLRAAANALTNLGSAITGYYTSGNNSGTNAMVKPNAIYIYNPLLQNRMRIHNILVERYA